MWHEAELPPGRDGYARTLRLPDGKDGKVPIRATVDRIGHRAPTDQTRWRETFYSKAAARRWADKIERLLDDGIDPDAKPVRPEAETLTLTAWRARWWPTYCRSTRKAVRSVEETDRRWRLHLEPRWGDLTLAALDRLDIQDWVDEELSGWAAPGTVELIYKDLHLLCAAAEDHRPPILTHNPCHKIHLPDPTHTEAIYTDAAGIAGIAQRCGPFEDLVWCLWGTGWRPACDGRPGYPRRQGTPGQAQWAPLVTGMKVHGVRHSHKAALEAGGIPDSAIEARLGHAVTGSAAGTPMCCPRLSCGSSRTCRPGSTRRQQDDRSLPRGSAR
ncbi:hypothetical protein FAIPA1_130136 [Frankia sp. AiPs1]